MKDKLPIAKWLVVIVFTATLATFPVNSSSSSWYLPRQNSQRQNRIEPTVPQRTIQPNRKPIKSTAQATVSPVADSYVSSTATSTNFGTALELRSKRSTLESYLRFDLTSLTESVISAKVRLTGQLNDTSGTNVVSQLFAVSNTTWSETGITWANKPSSSGSALASVTVTDNVPRLYEWDITAFVKSEMNAERHLISLALKNPSTSTPYATFSSREALSNTPELMILTTPPPTVNITSPAAGSMYLTPGTITIDADAADADGIAKVEFLQGTTVLNTDTVAPYSFTWSGVATGNYTLTARATDALGAVTTSVPVNISVVTTFPPTVTITSPASGTSFSSPATIEITADASDSDGISKVEFYQGSVLLGTVTSPPYTFSWSGMAACSYSLTARATDTLGGMATSAPVAVNVTGGQVGESTPPNFKVAFYGDMGVGPTSFSTLNLVKNEGAQALVVLGDLDYNDDPVSWEAQLNATVGPDFPVFVVIGNHDTDAWQGPTGYQKLVQDRFNHLGISWCGDLGVQSTFHYKGIFFVFTSPGIGAPIDHGNNHLYIRDQLAADHSIWTISGWHKNQHLMQAGGKSDEAGWEVYEESRLGGAIVATAHEHSYFRTHLLSSIMNQAVANNTNTFDLIKGNTFVFVSGLGGESRRDQEVTGPWVAKIYATPCLPGNPICQPNAIEGAMFGVFNVDGQQNKANFYFKDVNGQIIDSFTVFSQVDMPSIANIAPSEVTAGGPDFTLTVNGSNFINESTIRVNGAARPTTFVSSSQLTTQITAADILSGSSIAITVFNAVTGGGMSNQIDLAVNNPLPAISSIVPSDRPVCGGPFTLSVNGTNFVANSVIRLNGIDHATAFVSPTQLTADMTEADFPSAGIYNITVFNPAPGGGTSSSVSLPNPLPSATINTLAPANAVAGGAPFTLTVNGTNFCADSIVRFNGLDRTTTFISGTQLTAEISATDLQAPGNCAVTVFRPGSGSSNAVDFFVAPPVVDVFSISPDSAPAGGPAFTLTITGNNFFPGVITRWNGNDRPTTVLNGTQLTAEISAADIQNNGTAAVTVFVPGGGISAPITFTITCACGYEGDVAPRPNGSNNGTITISDWVQEGRFSAGLDIPNPGCEFERADISPLATRGNGAITISDWVQVGRYAANLEGSLLCADPSGPAFFNEVTKTVAPTVETFGRALKTARSVRLIRTKLSSDQSFSVSLELEAQGNENALGTTLNFDPSQLAFVTATTGKDARTSTLAVNSNNASKGHIGIALALEPGKSFPSGRREVVKLTFRSLGRGKLPPISFGDEIVRREIVDATGRVLEGNFESHKISENENPNWIDRIIGGRLFGLEYYLALISQDTPHLANVTALR